MADAVIGQRGLEKHLGEDVVLRKEGIDYFGVLDVDDEDVYFVVPHSKWIGSRSDAMTHGEELDVARLDSPGEDRIRLKGSYYVGSGQRAEQFRMFSYIG